MLLKNDRKLCWSFLLGMPDWITRISCLLQFFLLFEMPNNQVCCWPEQYNTLLGAWLEYCPAHVKKIILSIFKAFSLWSTVRRALQKQAYKKEDKTAYSQSFTLVVLASSCYITDLWHPDHPGHPDCFPGHPDCFPGQPGHPEYYGCTIVIRVTVVTQVTLAKARITHLTSLNPRVKCSIYWVFCAYHMMIIICNNDISVQGFRRGQKVMEM